MAQERRDVVITGDAEAWLQQRELVCITRAADGQFISKATQLGSRAALLTFKERLR